ncbi:MAG TPA: hypothetical protein VF050_11500 [Moraxellaceae bacterium]
MKPLWAMFWSICQLRRGPEDLPRSFNLLLLALLLDAFLGISVQLYAEPVSLQAAVGMVGIGLGLDALVLWALVRFKQQGPLYVQGLTAIYGADVMLGLVALPLVVASVYLAQSSMLTALVVLQMLLVGWNLAVRGFVYFRVLKVGIFLANMLSLTLFLLTIFISVKLFPELLHLPASP